MNKIKLPGVARQLKFFPENIYLVGGAVRDFLLEKKISDLDFVCKCNQKDFLKIGKKFFKNVFHINPFLIGKEFPPTLRGILNKKIVIDLTLLVDDFLNDAKRRDFTINAIYFDLKKNNIIDPLNGINDIKKRKIRICSKNSFKDDPLRLLRAVRFFGSLENFTFDKFTYTLLKKEAELIIFSAKERIKEEFDKIILLKNRYILIKFLSKLSILNKIIPNYREKNILKIKKIDEKLSDFEKKIFVYSLLLPEKFSHNIFIKFSNKEKKVILFLLKSIKEIENFSNQREIKKFILKNYYLIDYLIKFCKIIGLEKNLDILQKNYKKFLDKKDFIFSIINGNEIINFGFNEGKKIGELIETIRLLVYENKLKSKKEVINFLNSVKND